MKNYTDYLIDAIMYNEEDNKIKITRAFIMGFTYAWTNTKTFVAEQKYYAEVS